MSLAPEEKHAKLQEERSFLTSFFDAAAQGKFAEIERLVEDYSLKHNVPKETVVLQFRDGHQRTALHFACQSIHTSARDKDILEDFLLDGWLSESCVKQLIRLKDKEGLTPLMLAAQITDAKLSEKRVKVLIDVSMKDSIGDKLCLARSRSGATSLHYAAGSGATATTIRTLYQNGKVALHTFSKQGGTPLHWVCAVPKKDFTSTIGALLDCGADWNATNDSVFPPLAYALAAHNTIHAKFLLEEATSRCIDPSSTFNFELPGQTTLFHMVADLGLAGILAQMLELSPTPDILMKRNNQGLTAKELAAIEGNIGCVLLLLPEGLRTEEHAKEFVDEVKSSRKELSEPVQSYALDSGTPVEPRTPDNLLEDDALRIATHASSAVASDEDKKRGLELKLQGNTHFANHEYKEAAELYSQAIEADPAEATYYSNRSACYLHLQQPSDALHDAVICRFLKPDWSKAAYRMAVARLELGRYEDAAVAAWEGLQKDQDNDELKSILKKCVKLGRKESKSIEQR